ncbi:hypothetical protein BJV77DRAFT_1070962 [Russula vinacea]|nr:hypothetical protein BJV77DRAFT_1070962 [Russula vinacea]
MSRQYGRVYWHATASTNDLLRGKASENPRKALEGGSPDRGDLLPQKAGVSVMALEALANNPNVKLLSKNFQVFLMPPLEEALWQLDANIGQIGP